MPKDPRKQAAAHALHATVVNPSAHTAPARAAFHKRFELIVDPNMELPEADRLRMAEHARKAYFKRLTQRSIDARKARKQ
jgi:hypothetical protein